jgi:deazaflavin-dependent oxidoreductase (nitroreductase family)
LADPQFLYLTTAGWKTGKQHRIEIWYVKNNGKYYVMSELGKAAHWVRNISHDPKISFRINRLTFNGHARLVEPLKETQLTAQVSDLIKVKYDWDQGLIVELEQLNSGEKAIPS